MFKIGDKVVYPIHGAGIIESLEEKEFLGTMKQYYIVNIISNNMKIMIPKDKIEGSELRSISDEDALKNVFSILNSKESFSEELPPTRQRNQLFTDKIKSGSFRKNAEVIKDLMILNDKKPLSSTEKQLLDKAKKLLVGEIALIKDISSSQASDLLDETLEENLNENLNEKKLLS